MEKILYIIRGVAGSGKTTLASLIAEATGGRTHAADDFMVNEIGDYDFDPERLGYCHHRCRQAVLTDMKMGTETIIVHNTNTTERELAPYIELAKLFGYKIVSMVMERRHDFESTHGVPEHTLNRMRDRLHSSLSL